MFESRTLLLLQAENAALRGQISDMHSREMDLHRQWSEERKTLIDRIMALTNPLATRELARASGVPASNGIPGAATPADPVRRNWPAAVPNMRPTISPREKEAQLKAASIEEATDLERSQV